MFKKLLTAAVITLLIASSAFAAFTDVSGSHPNSEAIDYVESLGIVQGYDDGTYKPDQPINRVEFTKIIIASEFTQTRISNCNTSSFTDVPDGVWYLHYVCVAEMEGIVDGYPDHSYKPPNLITFAEASKIITNTIIEPTTEGSEVWYRPYVRKLEALNAIPTTINGFGHNLTRGEMAEMIYRLKEDIRNKDSRTYDQLANGSEIITTTKEFDMTARRFEFEPSTITVDLGDTVILNITSEDVTHGFALNEFGVRERLAPDQTIVVEFTADQKGTFSFFCNVICGSGHSGMQGTLIVN